MLMEKPLVLEQLENISTVISTMQLNRKEYLSEMNFKEKE